MVRRAVEKRGTVDLEVFNPTGDIEGDKLYAPRLESLNGKTIGEVSNGLWQADRTFELIRKLLQERFPDCRIIPHTELPYGSVQIDSEKIVEAVKEKKCDAVILGNAG
jgi:hypothetical protein